VVSHSAGGGVRNRRSHSDVCGGARMKHEQIDWLACCFMGLTWAVLVWLAVVGHAWVSRL
jgi:hypothetical protein